MLPGIWMSVNRSSMSERDSRRAIASSAFINFDGGKPRVLDHIQRAHAQQHLIFDNQNGAKNGGRPWSHGTALSSGAIESARASCSPMASNVLANYRRMVGW